MELWTLWLDTLSNLMNLLTSRLGLDLGVAIVIATVLLRVALLPISWPAAYRGCLRQKKMSILQPELALLREQYADKPDLYLKRMQALYAENGLTLLDGKSLLGSLVQMPVLLGMFQVLRNIGEGVRFLWVSNLLKPDLLLAVLAGLTTVLMIAVNPDLPDQMRLIMILVPSILAIVAALKFGSALSLYWIASNCFSALHTVAVHAIVGRRFRTG